MNINDLTIGQAKELAAMFVSQETKCVELTSKGPSAFIGEYVIARCYSAGVHAGEVSFVDGETVILKNSHRLWNWKANDGIALSGVAQSGVKTGCKIDTMNPEIYLTGVCELIPCTAQAKESINAYK